MNLDNLQQEVLYEMDIVRLFKTQIELNKLIKNTHNQKLLAKDSIEQSEAKGNLGIYYSMLEILRNRISELKDIYREENNEQSRINYNFRLASKKVLQKQTYNKIMDLAMLKRQEFKEIEKPFKRNKIE